MDVNSINSDEPLRPIKNIEQNNNLWKKIAFIFMGLFLCGLIVIIILVTTRNSKESENNNKYNWSPAGNRIKTKWGKELDPKKVWQEYPRPQLERDNWANLNGMWSYSIRNAEGIKPEKHDGKILVPFPIESSLSGLMKNFTEKDKL